MWQFENPVSVCFGAGALNRIADLIEGRPYCLVTYKDPFFAELTEKVTSMAGSPDVIVNNITTNPDFLSLSQSCRHFANKATTDTIIIALGGGSVIDAAKVLASSNDGFEVVKRFLETGEGEDRLGSRPLIAVPTTAGTGSEVTCWATVWDTVAQKKYSLARHDLYPTHAVVDPELMLGLPRDLTISTGLDALSHALESLWNRSCNPISAIHAVFAAKEIIDILPRLANDLQNLELRSRAAQASLFAGLAFSNTKTALAHSVSYPITLKYGVPHGLACSFSLPMVLASVIGADETCDKYLRQIFGDNLHNAIADLENFLHRLDVSTRASSYGVKRDEWKELLTSALAGERGRNFIGTKERVLENFTL
ncbi:phosphonoacetaldehyde reductase [Sneathiella marina]|uniref:Phosphonoacetaldehyde reductase n=1 Tax=Sneathiella marina TaxID=2950108 RepID=A0ABY4W8I3_9PROT|nr:iron-containing alcohol dehydrogenase PsrA [Sneathiella marina]USG61579.1 phosphonoacetaldehyde reductase [Sneathiella marina]